MKLKEMCADERPREKMLLRGVKSLSNAELLAVLIGSGVGGKNAVDLAQELLVAAGGRLTRLSSMPMDELSSKKGIGSVRVMSIMAAMELGRRCFEEAAVADDRPLTSPESVARLMLPQMKSLDHEELWIIMLNRSARFIGMERLTSGSEAQTVTDTRGLMRKVIEKQAAAVIMVHNHPGGSPVPSEADIRETKRVKNALKPLDIPLLDHVILGLNSFYSFSEDREFVQ